MSEFSQFLWAMWDSLQAALVGLNPAPVVIFSLFFGMIRLRQTPAWLMTGLAVIPAVIVTALLPMAMGYQAIWPDLTQLEIEFQIGILLAIGYVVIRAVGLIKATILSIAPKRTSQKPV
jgi:ABC-type glucose/galactose transport system permease subunit